MRLIIVTLALVACTFTAAIAGVPNMICRAEKGAAGPQLRAQEVTDVFRIENGRLYHRWSGREEYFYNHIVKADFQRYTSGHMLFVLGSDGRRGYVVIAAQSDWRIAYLDCK